MKKFLCMLLAAVMVLSCLAGCNKSGEEGKEETKEETKEASEVDTSEEVEIIMYFISDRPAGQDEIDENLNKILKEKLNCTLQINWISWSDYSNTYNLKLSSGEPIDLIYTAGWLGYTKLAQQGAFMALDELWPKYAPKNYERATDQAKMQAKVDGKTYCIPTLYATYSGYGPTYRLDVVKGTDAEGIQIKTFEDVEKYCEACKETNPKIMPLNIYENGSEWDLMNMRYKGYKDIEVANRLFYYDPTEKNPQIITLGEEKDVVDFLKMMERWNEKEFFSKSCLSDTDSKKLDEGKAFITVHNIDTFTGNYISALEKQNGYEWEFNNMCKFASHMPFTQDAVAVPNSAKNPERALMLWDLITSDQEVYDAFYYGIEGKSYELNDKGEKSGLNTDIYGESGMWTARTTGLMRNAVGTPDKTINTWNEWEEMIKKDDTWEKYSAFTVDVTGLDTEIANLTNVMDTYWKPLELALNTNGVEDGLAEFNDQLQKAGVEKVRAAFQAQLDAYVKEINGK